MNKLKQLSGYYYAVMNYLHTPKGRHDVVDYAQAAALIAAVAGIVWFIITYVAVD